jgi:hypothetical protein
MEKIEIKKGKRTKIKKFNLIIKQGLHTNLQSGAGTKQDLEPHWFLRIQNCSKIKRSLRLDLQKLTKKKIAVRYLGPEFLFFQFYLAL